MQKKKRRETDQINATNFIDMIFNDLSISLAFEACSFHL